MPDGLNNARWQKNDGRYWIRTSDPFRVKEVRYRCANRPWGQVAEAPTAVDRS